MVKFLTRDIQKKMFLVFFGILIWWMFVNINNIIDNVNFILQAFSPIIIGFIISFILNRPVMFFENKLLKSKSITDKLKRPISLLITIIMSSIIIVLVLLIVIPSLIDTGVELKDKFPIYIDYLKEYFKASSIQYPRLNQWIEDMDISGIKDNFATFLKGGLFDWLGSTFSFASSILGNIISFLLGFIFSIYFLLQKEDIIKSLKKILYSITPHQLYNKIMYISTLTNRAFSDFLLAQSLEAIILGSIFFLFMMIFKFPYSTMISTTIAVCSFIPIIGSFIGLLVGIVLIFVESPKLAGLFIVMFLVIQQIEGNIIYPRVVGRLSGLSPLLTLVAVTLGGGLMGVVGIILFIPLFVVIQQLVKEFIDNKLA